MSLAVKYVFLFIFQLQRAVSYFHAHKDTVSLVQTYLRGKSNIKRQLASFSNAEILPIAYEQINKISPSLFALGFATI